MLQICPTLPPEALLGRLAPEAALTVTAPGMPELKVLLSDPAAHVPESSIR